MVKDECEYRLLDLAIKDGDEMILEGRAVVYEAPTLITGKDGQKFREIITRGALTGADMSDVPLRYNHNVKGDYPILARTRNKSLELTADDDGLTIRAKLIDERMYNNVKSGLLDKMSFGFMPPLKKNVVWNLNTPDGIPERRINKIDRVVDVSVVDAAAYDATSIYARSFEALDSEMAALDSEKKAEIEVLKLKLKIKLKS